MIKLGNGGLNAIYPIGSIYISMNSINPSQLFGGTWEQIIGRFLWATNNTPGLTGGEKTHVLTIDELPMHSHRQNVTVSDNSKDINYNIDCSGQYTKGRATYQGCNTLNVGSDIAHNNMPPYLEVYIWKRTA